MDESVDGCFDGGLVVQISPLVHEFLAACSHFKRLQQLNEVAPENIKRKSVPFDTSHCEMLLLNEVASSNIYPKSVPFDTSHCEMLLLSEVAPTNIYPKSVPFDTSHCEMS